jgi:zinc protease
MDEPPGRSGLALLAAEMLEEGTRALSGNELVDELDGLGAHLTVSAGDDDLNLRLSVLDECLPRALELLRDLVLAPRFAAADFARVQRARLVQIDTRGDRIRELADDGFARLLFGPQHPRGAPVLGTRAGVAAFTPEDVRAFWSTRARAESTHLCVVGAHASEGIARLIGALGEAWPSGASAAEPRAPSPPAPTRPGLFLIDKPGAAQSELRIGHRAVASTDPDFYPLQALGTVLGGAFSSRLNMNLREKKGYTYGVHGAFVGGLTPGALLVQCAVASAVTAPAVAEAVAEVRGIRGGIQPAEADFARKSLTRALTRSLESSQARLGLLERIARYGYAHDVIERRLAWLGTMTASDLDALAARHVRPEELVVLVVGDGALVREPLARLGLGPLVELDPNGAPLEP